MKRVVLALAIALACVFGVVRANAQHASPPPAPAVAPSDKDQPDELDPADHADVRARAHRGPHGEAADGESQEHGPHAINWFDFGNKEQPPYLSQLINFAVLLGIFYFFGKKPITEALKGRRAAVAKEIEEAQRMRKEAEERAKTYQAKLERLEEELVTTKAALVEAGRGERDRVIKEAEEKAERMSRDATELLQQEAKQMQQDLVRETVEIAMRAAEEMLKQKITSADHERLADDYLAGLMKANAKAQPKGGVS